MLLYVFLENLIPMVMDYGYLSLAEIDTSDDRRVDYSEFKRSLDVLSNSGATIHHCTGRC